MNETYESMDGMDGMDEEMDYLQYYYVRSCTARREGKFDDRTIVSKIENQESEMRIDKKRAFF